MILRQICFVVLVAIAPATHAQHLPVGADRVAVALEKGGNLLFVPVAVNGRDAGHFIVDTGAANTVIDSKVAESLKLPRLRQVNVVGTGGRSNGWMHNIASMKLGRGQSTFEVGRHAVASTDLSEWEKTLGVKVSGLLGYDAFKLLPFTIDYRAATMTFFDRERFTPPSARDTHLEKLTLIDERPRVPAWVNEKLHGLVMIDTGVQGYLQLEPSFVAEHKDLSPKNAVEVIESVGVGGAERVRRGWIDQLYVFARRFNRAPAYFPPPGHRSLARPPRIGLVGGQFLRHFRLTFDYKTARLWAQWHPDNPVAAQDAGERGLNDRDFIGRTVLCDAAFAGNAKLIEALIRAGADANVGDRTGRTPLFFAVRSGRVDSVDALIDSKARVNAVSRDGETALMVACQNGKIAIVRTLIAANADVNLRSKQGLTALKLATSNGHDEIAALLRKAGAR